MHQTGAGWHVWLGREAVRLWLPMHLADGKCCIRVKRGPAGMLDWQA